MLFYTEYPGSRGYFRSGNGRLITCSYWTTVSPLPAFYSYWRRISLATFLECFRNSSGNKTVYPHLWWLSDGIRHWSPAGSFITAVAGIWSRYRREKLQVFPLADIKSVSLTSERFWNGEATSIQSLVVEERFISALPHFFIHKLINTFNLWSLACQSRPDRYGDNMLNRKLNIRLRHSRTVTAYLPSLSITPYVHFRGQSRIPELFSPAVHCGIILRLRRQLGCQKRLVSDHDGRWSGAGNAEKWHVIDSITGLDAGMPEWRTDAPGSRIQY